MISRNVLAIGLVAFSFVCAASAQWTPVYETTFPKGNATHDFELNHSISGADTPGYGGNWTTNDYDTFSQGQVNLYDPVGSQPNDYAFIGQSEYATNALMGATNTNYVATFGGNGNLNAGIVPGHSTVYLWHDFSINSAVYSLVRFDVDQQIFDSTPLAPFYTNQDTFGWTFGTNNATLFSLMFTPRNATLLDVKWYNSAGVAQTQGMTANWTISYNAINNFTVVIDSVAKTFDVWNSNQTVAGTHQLIAGGNLSTAPINGNEITRIAATWILSDNTTSTPTSFNGGNTSVDGRPGYYEAGFNSLNFDNYTVSVPEPAVATLIFSGLVFGAMRRRRS